MNDESLYSHALPILERISTSRQASRRKQSASYRSRAQGSQGRGASAAALAQRANLKLTVYFLFFASCWLGCASALFRFISVAVDQVTRKYERHFVGPGTTPTPGRPCSTRARAGPLCLRLLEECEGSLCIEPTVAFGDGAVPPPKSGRRTLLAVKVVVVSRRMLVSTVRSRVLTSFRMCCA